MSAVPTPQDLVGVATGACATIAAVLFGFGGVVFGLYAQIVRDVSQHSQARPGVVDMLERYLREVVAAGVIATLGAVTGVLWFLWPIQPLYWTMVVLTLGTFGSVIVVALRLIRSFTGDS